MNQSPRLATAYQEFMRTENGRLVLADILVLCSHLQPTNSPETRVLQQFAIELLQRAGLFDDNRGSFPFDYVSMLTRAKLEELEATRPEEQAPPAPRRKWPNLLGRLLGRKKN